MQNIQRELSEGSFPQTRDRVPCWERGVSVKRVKGGRGGEGGKEREEGAQLSSQRRDTEILSVTRVQR